MSSNSHLIAHRLGGGDIHLERPPICELERCRTRRFPPKPERHVARSAGNRRVLTRPGSAGLVHNSRQAEGAGAEIDTRLSEGLRQVRSSTGSGSVNTVVEVAPWSRIPEARALLVPRDD